MAKVKVGIIGFGFMGTTHFGIHQASGKSEVVAIADADADKRKGDIRKVIGNIGGAENTFVDLTGIAVYEDGMQLIQDPNVEEVDICAPTYMHAKFAIAALEAGKNVLLEKPIALNVAEAEAIVAAAKKTDKCFTVGLCVRAWPEYRKAYELVKAGKIGKIKSMLFKRFSPNIDGNAWQNWFMNDKLSGGSLLDLHMHDIDEVLYFYGRPKAVTCTGTVNGYGSPDHSFTIYHFDNEDAPSVVAEGGWSAPASAPFEMSFQLIGTEGTLISDPAGFVFYPVKGTPEKIELPDVGMPTGWHVEINNFIDAIQGKSSDQKFLPYDDILDGAKIYAAERASFDKKGERVEVEY